MTRVAIGLPSYQGATHVRQAVSSLLSQTYRDFVLACVDDASTDGTSRLIATTAGDDARVVLRRNDHRLGLVANWKLAFELASEACPDMTLFAWVSDHDVWDRRWLERLVEHLDAHPEAVLAYPLNVGIDEAGRICLQPWRFDTAGSRSVRRRLPRAVQGMVAGSMVYGLYRAEALRRCGVFRPVIFPDRLLLSELALYGEFHQVDEVLWSRRYRKGVKATVARQRRAFFPKGAPLHSYLPWSVTHSAALAWSLIVRGSGRPRYGRVAGILFVAWYSVRTAALSMYRRVRTAGHELKERIR